MHIKRLSSNEKIVIKRIAQMQIESFTRLTDKGSPIFEEMKAEYAEEEIKVNDFEIQCQLADEVIEFEKVLLNPEHLFTLDSMNLMAAQYIVAVGVSEEKFPKTKKSLLSKLHMAREVKNNLN